MLLFQMLLVLPVQGFSPQTAAGSPRESMWMSHTQRSSDFLPHNQTTSDHRKWCFIGSNISEGSDGCPRDRIWREKMPFLGREHSSPGQPGPSVLTCLFRAPSSLLPGLNTQPGLRAQWPPCHSSLESSPPMVTTRRWSPGHGMVCTLYGQWGCALPLITALHLPALLLRRTVGEGLEHPSHQTVDHHY